MKTSITGIPGIAGPPVPARVILVVIGLFLNINAIAVALDGDEPAATWVTFVIVYILSVGIPQAIAYKHRTDGWESAPMV